MKMVDQALRKGDSPSTSINTPFRYDRPKALRTMRQYSRNEAFRDYIKSLESSFQYEIGEPTSNSNHLNKRKPDSEHIQKALLDYAFELLNSSSSETENLSVQREIQKLESDYKYVMEKFLSKMEIFLYSCDNLLANMQKTIRKFKSVSRMTAQVTLVSSALELSLLVGNALQKIFHFGWNPNLSNLEAFGGSASIAAALFALTYMRWSSADITKEVRDENNFLMDLMVLHRKGNWIDEEVLNLFPYGINMKLLDESGLNNRMPNRQNKSWRHDLCYAILLTNTQKDVKLLKDDKFLTTLKMFVRSHAAEIWWNRRKIKKLLDSILKKVEATSVKDITADHDIHFKKIALYLYPVMIPLLLNSWNTGRMKFLCSSLLLILSFYDLSKKDSDDAEELKKVISNFEKDFKEIKEICQSLDSEDE